MSGSDNDSGRSPWTQALEYVYPRGASRSGPGRSVLFEDDLTCRPHPRAAFLPAPGSPHTAAVESLRPPPAGGWWVARPADPCSSVVRVAE